MSRIYNFSAGPATLPTEVLEDIQEELLDYNNSGMSVMEMSHRSKDYSAIHQKTKEDLKRLLNIPSTHEVLFMTGGASSQFAFIPMNFTTKGDAVGYIDTGSWSSKAIEEATKLGREVKVCASSKDQNYNYLPTEFDFDNELKYVHITSNNTIFGTQFKQFPEVKSPFVADMSSDILSRPLDISKFQLIYAGAQKNLGPAGLCLVIAEKSFVESATDDIPTMFQYKTHLSKDSLYNTPPSFIIYIVGKVLEWIDKKGGLKAVEELNKQKAQLLFDILDTSEFYRPTVQKEFRSLMNVTFRLPTEDLEKQFIDEATQKGFSGLKGHRSVGGCRASIYNSFPPSGVADLVQFMTDFEKKA